MPPDEPILRTDWVVANLGAIGQRLGEHLVMTAVAVVIGFAISFALSLLIWRYRLFYTPVLAVSGILYTIPSLALFFLIIPIFGFTLLSAEIALVSYTFLILVRNTVAGLDAVPDEIREAATGMGFTRWQRLWRVELPMAVPIMVAGIRIATVTTVGLVTVTALIGQGGLGYFIVTLGIRTFFPTAILVGSALSIVLAVIADIGLLQLERRLTPWARARSS
ncbi:MAG TPA: ABC transporter permease [Candidatus Limnocylindria bacterium]|nr:ABC transporter permease [Candidatus Limnocylindria bacterium]